MSDETQQPAPEPTIPTENTISEPSPIPQSPQEPIPDAPIPPADSAPSEVSPDAPQASPSPESAIMDKDQNLANEPLESTPIPENTSAPENPNITVEKHGNDVTITEVMEPKASDSTEATPDKHPEPVTAQMAGNEPLAPVSTINPDGAKQKRKENLERANTKRQKKKREKIDEIMTLFSEKPEITNDEVEKLLHVSDATATRYLEQLEKEGKIRQVGKTGKHTHYEKI